ncbi:MAG: bifunctional phosphoribosylaminoimidazolecarboxamide formyltransferase/IMP cyclohydrolase [Pseudomonadota bacterium]
MGDVIPVKRALISVSDKTGLVEFATALAGLGVELVSTGGTSGMLRDQGLAVKDVSDLTGFPEMMDGRVKTLHPVVHGGLLALRDNADHVASMDEHGIGPIDLVVVNLYPFEATVAAGAAPADVIENIDIGGPAMIRSAAKNHGFVGVVVDVEDYAGVIEEMQANGGLTQDTRTTLAARAYGRTAAYDAAVSAWFAGREDASPRRRAFAGTLAQDLRYGENPHQVAAFYRDGSDTPGVATAVQHQGKALSYNNINDTDAAVGLVADFPLETAGPAVAIIKHANPCGVATGDTFAEAFGRAFDCDRTSAFGGIVALNGTLDGDTARKISEIFTEVVIAPDATDEAKEVFTKKKNLRLLTMGSMPAPGAARLSVRQVSGGWLVQDEDAHVMTADQLQLVTQLAPTASQTRDLLFAWTVAKHVKSNAIVYAKDRQTVGVGAGQMSRVDSSTIAALKAGRMGDELGLAESPAAGSVVASDAFFPFADGLLAAAQAGAKAIIQPGGSVRDAEVIAAADEAGLAMVFTGIRHFRH